MARTRSIPRLVAHHRGELAQLRDRLESIADQEATERAWQAEAISFRAAVEWEILSSRWLVATLNKNNAAMREFVLKELTRGFSEKYPEFAEAGHIELVVVPPRHFNVSMVETLIDPSGRNSGFWSRDHVKKWKELMPAEYNARVASFQPNDWRVLAVLSAVRNVVAHRSPAATRTLNETLDDCRSSTSRAIQRLAPTSRPIHPGTLGSHLQATPSGARASRAETLVESLDRVIARLDVNER